MFIDERTLKDRITKPSLGSYALKSKADVIKQPYGSYDLFFEMTFKAIPKLGKYEDIGSLKECRKAMKKQTAKSPIIMPSHYSSDWACECPSCHLVLRTLARPKNGEPPKIENAHTFELRGENTFCNRCGQKIDWSDLYE